MWGKPSARHSRKWVGGTLRWTQLGANGGAEAFPPPPMERRARRALTNRPSNSRMVTRVLGVWYLLPRFHAGCGSRRLQDED